jgi:hypothetical protein
MTRAAILFASATAIAGCGGKEADDINNKQDPGGNGTSSSSTSSSTSSTSSSSGGTSSGTSGQPLPMYGPAVIDAGDDGGKDRGDGGVKRDGGVVALYGPAPVDAGS